MGMWKRGLQRFAIGFLVFAWAAVVGPAWAVVSGDFVITERGQAVNGATVTLVDEEGEEIAASEKTSDDKGGLYLALDDDEAGKTLTVVITKKDGSRKEISDFVVPEGDWGQYRLDLTAGAMTLLRGPFMAGKPPADLPPGTKKPVTVGSNSEVGSGAQAAKKTRETATGLLGGLAGGLFGGRITPGGGGEEPELVTDPIPDPNKRVFTDAATGTKIQVGLKTTPAGLVVSARVVDSPGDATFQSVFLQDATGKRAGPTRYAIYELYRDWNLSVSWTRDRWANGQHVQHAEGGWTTQGRDILGTFKVPDGKKGIWSRLGFPNAVKGIRTLGTHFPVSGGLLTSRPMTLVIHLTRPRQDPVTTAVFAFSIAPGQGVK